MRQPLKIGQWKWEWQGNANGNGNRNENQLFQLRIPIVRSVWAQLALLTTWVFGSGFRVSVISNWSNLARRRNKTGLWGVFCSGFLWGFGFWGPKQCRNMEMRTSTLERWNCKSCRFAYRMSRLWRYSLDQVRNTRWLAFYIGCKLLSEENYLRNVNKNCNKIIILLLDIGLYAPDVSFINVLLI